MLLDSFECCVSEKNYWFDVDIDIAMTLDIDAFVNSAPNETPEYFDDHVSVVDQDLGHIFTIICWQPAHWQKDGNFNSFCCFMETEL